MKKSKRVVHDTFQDSDKYVLTNDPSITAWGWAVVDPVTNVIVDCGAIKTGSNAAKLRIRKGDDRVRRIQEINIALLSIIDKYKIKLIVSELPHGSQSAVAAVMIGITTGVMQTIGDCLKIPVEWFSEQDAKVAILHKRSAEKTEMITAIQNLWRDEELMREGICNTGVKWKDEAVADALAVYYVARQQSAVLKMLVINIK